MENEKGAEATGGEQRGLNECFDELFRYRSQSVFITIRTAVVAVLIKCDVVYNNHCIDDC